MTAACWSLAAALGIGDAPELVALVGGGGKTSLLFALAAELPGRVVMTTTTRIFAAQMSRAPAVVYADDLSPLGEALAAHGRCLVVGRVEGDKALGVPPDLPAQLLARPDVATVLVEADGSRMRPVKAPAEHEPVIPPGTTLLVPLAGIDALEGPLEEVGHRAEKIREITNYELRITNEEGWSAGGGSAYLQDGWLTAAGLARVLGDGRGGLKGAPAGARVIPFINKVETAARLAAARETAVLLLAEPRIDRVVIGSLRGQTPVPEVRRRVAAVVLAAGESRRMGRNKLLLPWGATTVLGQTIANAQASAVAEVMVVVGHESEVVTNAAREIGEPNIVTNLDYAKGMLTSVQSALRHLPPTVEAVLVLLGDQPMVAPAVLDALLDAYAASPYGLVAPVFENQRGNPVLIDRRYFNELLALPPEAAPRRLLQRHPDDLLPVAVDSDAVLHDLDRPEDYERWRPGA
jgi:molybdenum cofactor cytidylyltransferase